MFPGLVVTCFFVSLLCAHIYPSGGNQLSSANRVTPIQSTDSDLSPSMFQESSMVASSSTSRLVSLNINLIQRYRKIVVRNTEFRPWSNTVPVHVISYNTLGTLVHLQRLDLDLGRVLFFF